MHASRLYIATSTQRRWRLQDLKLKYYDMMIQYALHQSAYLDAAKYYHKVWETPSIKEEVDGRGREVGNALSIIESCDPHILSGSRTHCLLRGPRTS